MLLYKLIFTSDAPSMTVLHKVLSRTSLALCCTLFQGEKWRWLYPTMGFGKEGGEEEQGLLAIRPCRAWTLDVTAGPGTRRSGASREHRPEGPPPPERDAAATGSEMPALPASDVEVQCIFLSWNWWIPGRGKRNKTSLAVERIFAITIVRYWVFSSRSLLQSLLR